jgi:hypothetical protein
MPSDPPYGTTGFFSYLWSNRIPVYDFPQGVSVLTDDTGKIVLTDDTGTIVLTTDDFGPARLIRWI